MDKTTQELNLLRDYVTELKALALKAEVDRAADSKDAFLNGLLFGLVEALSLLQQQATAFGISPDSIGLRDFDAERDLLNAPRSDDSSSSI